MAEENDMAIQDIKIHRNMDQIGRKILVMSGKGGVGKTTVTVNLANALVDMGYSVGILDTDIHGPNVAKMLGCEGQIMESNEKGDAILPVCPREGLKVVSLSFALASPDQAIIFRGPMKMSVIRQFLADVQWGTLDYLLIDSPPGTGDEQLTVCQTIPDMTGSIIVTTPQQVAILDARKSVTFARQLDLRVLGVVENMSYLICPDCKTRIHVFGKGGGQAICKEMELPLLATIPMEIDLQQSEDNGINYLASKKDGEVAKAFRDLAKYIHDTTEIVHTPYVPDFSSCSPSSCATCSLDCPSKKG